MAVTTRLFKTGLRASRLSKALGFINSLGVAGKGISTGSPSLVLDFLEEYVFDSRITYSGQSARTFFDRDGLLKVQGYNLLRYSADFTNTWTVVGATVTKTTVVLNGTSSTTNYVGQTITSGWTTGSQTITASFTASTSNASGNLLKVRLTNGVDLTNGDPVITLSTTPTRYSTTFTFNATVPSNPAIRFWTTDATTGAATLTITDMQVETSSTATQYSPTTTAANSAPRLDYDPATPAGTTGGELSAIGTSSSLSTYFDAIQPTSGVVSLTAGVLRIYSADGTIAQAQDKSATFTSSLTTGKTYKLSFTLTKVSGNCLVLDAASNTVATLTTSGDYSVNITKTAAYLFLIKRQSGVTDFTVSNISIQEVTFAPRGLLVEEQRTNLTYGSDTLVTGWGSAGSPTYTANVTSPTGVTNSASTWTRTLTSSTYISQVITKAASALQYTCSVFVKKNTARYFAMRLQGTYPARVDVVFDLDSSASQSTAVTAVTTFASATAGSVYVGGGWYRVWMTATSDTATSLGVYFSFNANNVAIDGTDSSATSSGFLFGSQLEQAAFMTSYISSPVAATSGTTRSADSVSMVNTNFSNWYNQSAGTIVIEYSDSQTLPVERRWLSINDTTTLNRFVLNRGASATSEGSFGSVVTAASNVNTSSASFVKTAFAFDSYGTIMSTNGTSATAGAIVPPTMTQMNIGSDRGVNIANAHYRRIQFYQTKLTEATCNSLTI